MLAAFRDRVPESLLQVRIGNTQGIATAVADFSIDLGLVEGPCHLPDLVVQPWLEDELVIVAAPTHALARAARHARLNVKQLRNAPWLLREPGSGTREAVEHILLPHLQHLAADMTLGSSEAIKNAVVQGLGTSCLSRCVVQDLIAAKRLVVLPTTLPKADAPLRVDPPSQEAVVRGAAGVRRRVPRVCALTKSAEPFRSPKPWPGCRRSAA